MSGYEADSDSDPLTEIEMVDIEYENSSIQILEPPTPEIINLVSASEEIKDRESSKFTKSDGINISPSLPDLTYVLTLTTSFWFTTLFVPPLVYESVDPSFLDLLQYFEPTSLPYSPFTTHTSDHCHCETFMPSLIGNASITTLSSHTPVYTISEP